MKTFEEIKELFLSQPWGQGNDGEICYYIGELNYPAYSRIVNASIADRLIDSADAELDIFDYDTYESSRNAMYKELSELDWNANQHEAKCTAIKRIESFGINYEAASDFVDSWCIFGVCSDEWAQAALEDDPDFLKIVQQAFEEQDGKENG